VKILWQPWNLQWVKGSNGEAIDSASGTISREA
jgi:hypothetical protein